MDSKIFIVFVAFLLNAVVSQDCASDAITFTVDLTQPGSQWDHYWERCVGSGHALLALRQDWRNQLVIAHNALGFQYVRFHGLFDDDMSVYSVDSNGNPIYSFFNIDSIFDFLLSIGMKPLVELSFMPEAMASGNATIFHYKGNITPPKNYTLWYNLVQTLVTHLVGRYGIDEIRSWHFETWNEPNCGFWTGTQMEYFYLLNVTWTAIKSVDPKIPVGGPATCQSQWLPETLAYAAKNGFELDFVSTHEYPTDVTPTERDTLKQVMTKARQEVGENMPLFYTEYNDGLYWPALHDDIYASAFAIFNIQDVYGIPDIMSWWTFTDIFEEGGFNSMPFQGNYGLQTIYGIPKPSFRAFEILHETGNTRAVVNTTDASSTAGVYATLNATHLHIIAYNHNVSGGAIESQDLCIQVTGIDSHASFQAHLRRIDANNANPIATWQSMGSPEYPTPSQIQAMYDASEMIRTSIGYQVINSNTIAFSLTVPEEGVAVITMRMR